MYLHLLKESFLFAFSALRTNKVRTFLSLLGITIGIFTIIAILTSVDALKQNVKSSIDKLGSNTLVVEKWPLFFGEDYPWWKYLQRKPIQEKDFDALMPRVKTVEAGAFYMITGNATLTYKSNSTEGAYFIGMTPEMNQVFTMDIAEGRYFTLNEFKTGQPRIIIGYNVANGLFPTENPIGKTVKLHGLKATVIGVLEKEGKSILKFSNNDDCVFLPLNFMKTFVNMKTNNWMETRIMLKGKENIPIDEVEAEIMTLMRSIRYIRPLQEEDFAVNKITVLSNQIDGLFTILNLAGWIIGGFSILVGGFGIANIMFVSVKERTNIIGIQKSLGAKNFFILFQFLAESVTLCFIGGGIGIILIMALCLGITYVSGIDFTVKSENILVGVGISLTIGASAGFIPAYVASKLDPVEAIRSK